MKLSVSNIGFRGLTLSEFGPILEDNNIDGVEVSLGESFRNLDEAEISAMDYREELKKYKLQVSGIQALLHGKQDLQFLRKSDWNEIENHLLRIMNIASKLNASVLVFGSPKNRIKGELSHSEACSLLGDFLLRLIPALKQNNLSFAIEPNASFYGADFLRQYSEVVSFCEQIGSDLVVPQIDTGCLELEENDLDEALRLQTPSHVHLSSPGLETIAGKENIGKFVHELNNIGYRNWTTIEMLGDGFQGLEAVIAASKTVR